MHEYDFTYFLSKFRKLEGRKKFFQMQRTRTLFEKNSSKTFINRFITIGSVDTRALTPLLLPNETLPYEFLLSTRHQFSRHTDARNSNFPRLKWKESLRETRLFSYRKKNKLPLYFHPAPSPIVRSIRRSEIHTRIYRQTERKRQKWRRKRRRNRFLESGGIDR